MFNTLTDTDIQVLREIVGAAHFFDSMEKKQAYGHDETESLVFLPEAVVLPADTDQISRLMAYCHTRRIPVTVRGGGSGLAGGALPVCGGLLLSTERLNQILHIDDANYQVTVQPGVITEVLQDTLRARGLFYPPDPSSRGWCHIGGNISTNAGGPRAVKYGVVKDYVLSLEVVLPTGEVIKTGANTLKNSTGYSLTQLIVGSEGTLCVITQAVLKLQPYPTHNLLMLAPFGSATQACAAVAAIFQAGVTPSALEFMERSAIDWTLRYLGDVALPVGPEVAAHLLIEVDGHHLDTLLRDCETINEVLQRYDCGDILFADDEATKANLWRLRRNVAHAVKKNSIYKEEDTVVPRAQLPVLLQAVKEIGARYGFQSVCYGHAGDGNLHVNIIRGTLTAQQWEQELPTGIREIFEVVKSLGGTLSGEHGVGWVQKRYIDLFFDAPTRRIMHAIKQVFDPHGILNPEKILP